MNEKNNQTNNIDIKIKKLLEISNNFIFPEYYTHTHKIMWKILNPYNNYSEEKLVLCGIDEGIEKSLDLAITYITKSKEKYYKYE